MRAAIVGTAILFMLTGCGSSGHLLDQYPRASQTLTVVVSVPESPLGRAVKVDSWNDSHEDSRVVVMNPTANRQEHIWLQDQLDSTLLLIDAARVIEDYAFAQSEALLDVETTYDSEAAGLLLEVTLRVLDVEAGQSQGHAWIETVGEARLVDTRTGRRVWHMPLNTTPRRPRDVQHPAVSVPFTVTPTRSEEELFSVVNRLCDALAQYIVRQLERDYRDVEATG